MHIGLAEIVIIVLLAVAIFSPEQLNDFAKQFGLFLHKFKEYKKQFDEEIKDPVTEPFNDIKKEINDIKK